MATSGNFSYTPTTMTVITAAMRKINRLGDFDTLTTSDHRYVAALDALQIICKEFATKGMPLWAIETVTVPFTALSTITGATVGPTGTVVVAGSPLRVLQAIRRDNTSTTDIDLNIFTQWEYGEQNNKTSIGAPTMVWYRPTGPANSFNGTLNVWPLPSTYWTTNGSLLLRYQRPFQDAGTSVQELDFPKQYHRAIIYTLAYDLAPEYGLDPTQRGFLKSDRNDLEKRADEQGTEEGSIYFSPSSR